MRVLGAVLFKPSRSGATFRGRKLRVGWGTSSRIVLKNINKSSCLDGYEKRRYRQRYRQIFWLDKPPFRSGQCTAGWKPPSVPEMPHAAQQNHRARCSESNRHIRRRIASSRDWRPCIQGVSICCVARRKWPHWLSLRREAAPAKPPEPSLAASAECFKRTVGEEHLNAGARLRVDVEQRLAGSALSQAGREGQWCHQAALSAGQARARPRR
jgi:hypothetical protein